MRIKAKLMDATAMDRALTRIAHEIIEKNQGMKQVYLVGIQRRGVPMAERIADKIEEIEGERPSVGMLDITFYRDDLSLLSQSPVVNASQITGEVAERKIILVDDVMYTGRTVRAAIEAIFHLGRPAAIQLAVMIDRGHRELPLRPDFVGKNVPTSRSELVAVKMLEYDGEDVVELLVDEQKEQA